jgi:hypothetical protein
MHWTNWLEGVVTLCEELIDIFLSTYSIAILSLNPIFILEFVLNLTS